MSLVDDSKGELKAIREAIHAEFDGEGAIDRLNQLDAHMATVEMVIDCLEDESGRMSGYKKEKN